MTVVKICGIKDVAIGLAAIDAGADYLGFVFYPPSIRALTPQYASTLIRALRDARPNGPPEAHSQGWKAVGVFVNEPLSLVDDVRGLCQLDVVQLNGEEMAEYIAQIRAPVFKAVRFVESAVTEMSSAAAFGAARVLVDANVPGRYGGTGLAYEWTAVRGAVADGFLAGGLTPDNVAEAIAAARPWGVDVSSGVEVDGLKSSELIRRFIEAVRKVEATVRGDVLSGRAGACPPPPADTAATERTGPRARRVTSAKDGGGQAPALPDPFK